MEICSLNERNMPDAKTALAKVREPVFTELRDSYVEALIGRVQILYLYQLKEWYSDNVSDKRIQNHTSNVKIYGEITEDQEDPLDPF